MHTSGERALCHDAPQTILALVSETTGDYRQLHGPSGCRPRVFLSLSWLAFPLGHQVANPQRDRGFRKKVRHPGKKVVNESLHSVIVKGYY